MNFRLMKGIILVCFIMTILLLISGNYLYKRTNGRVYFVFQIIGIFLLVVLCAISIYIFVLEGEGQ